MFQPILPGIFVFLFVYLIFKIITMPVAMKWYVIVVLICISLMCNDEYFLCVYQIFVYFL